MVLNPLCILNFLEYCKVYIYIVYYSRLTEPECITYEGAFSIVLEHSFFFSIQM